MAAVRLPEVNPELLTRRLFEHYRIEVPVFRCNERLLLRVSFQAYNDETDRRRASRGVERGAADDGRCMRNPRRSASRAERYCLPEASVP